VRICLECGLETPSTCRECGDPIHVVNPCRRRHDARHRDRNLELFMSRGRAEDAPRSARELTNALWGRPVRELETVYDEDQRAPDVDAEDE
jgi:rRNA maturation protein Nop10